MDMGQQGGKEKEGGRGRERQTDRQRERKLMECKQELFEIQLDIRNDSKWAKLSQCTP